MHSSERYPEKPRREQPDAPDLRPPRPTLDQRLADLVSGAPPNRRGRPAAQAKVSVDWVFRQPHLMYGKRGYSVASNDFLLVVAMAITTRGMTAAEAGVLLYCMGSQNNGLMPPQTQQAIADQLQLPRSTTSAALKRLEGWHMVRKYLRTGEGTVYQVNPQLCFKGNGDNQQAELDAARLLQLAPGDFPDLVIPTPRPKKGRPDAHAD